MSEKGIEKQLKKAVKHATPDMRERVIEACKNEKKNNSDIIYVNKPRAKWHKHRTILFNLASVAAVLLLVLIAVIDISRNTKNTKVDTIIDIDVNPSIELYINADDRIISAKAVNEDAIAILEGMELEGAKTKVAINAIVGSMFQHGYLTGNTNAILVSVENNDTQKSAEIQDEITQDIDVLVRAYTEEITVIGQVIESDVELSDMAVMYGISEGKATLIRKVIEYSDIYSEDELVTMTIAELNELLQSLQNGGNDIQEPAVSEECSVSSNSVSGNGIDGVIDDSAVVSVSSNTVSDNSVDTEDLSNIDEDTVDGDNIISNENDEANITNTN